ncbi:SymE family type I addiction module toxin [Burkholderia sp. BE12]|uniref:SymE family type I addiction module toxin n=1 Tax=Burkholderia sp. BE12 TaxID=2082394 RepID=UPI0018F8B3C4|nr:SymE family type I addiction module toxin [Burkholderia sp. BE12]
MADANHNAPVLFPDRFVTIQESYRDRTVSPNHRGKYRPKTPPVAYPWMKLSGRWIETAGFEPAQRVRIEVTQQRLVITPVKESDCDVARHGIPMVNPNTGLRRRMLPGMGVEHAESH